MSDTHTRTHTHALTHTLTHTHTLIHTLAHSHTHMHRLVDPQMTLQRGRMPLTWAMVPMAVLLCTLISAGSNTLAQECQGDFAPDSLRAVFLMEGSISITDQEFEHLKSFSVNVGRQLLTSSAAAHTVAAIEFSTFPCAAETQCTPFVTDDILFEEYLDSVVRSAGFTRTSSAITYALDTRLQTPDPDRRSVLIVLVKSAPFQSSDDILPLLTAAGVDAYFVVISSDPSVADAYRAWVPVPDRVAVVDDLDMLSSTNTAAHITSSIACPGEPQQ